MSRNSQVFKLAEFNPDTSSYAIEEWLDDGTELKNELHVSDILIIVKAGETLKGCTLATSPVTILLCIT
jgi:hypothetical protein